MSTTADIGETHIATRDDPSIRVWLHMAVLDGGNPLLDDRQLTTVSLQGHEQVSSPFEFQIELHGNTQTSDPVDVSFEKVIGHPVTLGIDRPSATGDRSLYTEARIQRFARAVRGEAPTSELSLFNGIATSFSMAEPGVYRMTVRPALHRTNLTNRYCVYAGKTIRDVIEAILERHGIRHDLTRISAPDNPANARVQDWLQAGESDFEVIQRLMPKAHLYYYFVHDATSHTIVFANDAQYPAAFEDPDRPLHYVYTDDEGLDQEDQIQQYDYSRQLTTTGVHTTFVRSSEAWEHGAVRPYTTWPSGDRGDLDALPCHIYKVYAYGASRPEADGYNDLSWRALQTSTTTLRGSSLSPMLRAAHTFVLAGSKTVRPTLNGQRFVLNSVKHQADAGGKYHNQFEATEADGFLAQFSLQDTQQGTILAEVTGHGDAPSDWRFYQKTVFDPATQGFEDRAAASDGSWTPKGVMVRLATDDRSEKDIWVKLSAQMQSVPEIGAIVEIGRGRDASELPEIQNTVQANGQRTVTPSGWTAHTSVGSNYSTSYGDGISIGFGRNSNADLDRAKKIVLDAYQRRQPSVGPAGTAFGHASYNQGTSYSYSQADDGRNGVLSCSESHGSTYSRHSGADSESESDIDNQKSWSTVHDKSYSESHIGESENHSTIERDSHSTSTVKGNTDSTSTIKGNSDNQSTINGNSTSTSTVDGNSSNDSTINGTSTSTSTVNGKSSNTSTVNADSTSHSTVNGDSTNDSTVNGSSYSTSHITGTSNQKSFTGASNATNLTGASNSTSLTGVSNQTNISGATNQINIGGATSNINITGATSTINVAGAWLEVSVKGPGMEIANKPATSKITLGPESTDVDVPGIDLTLVVGLAIYL